MRVLQVSSFFVEFVEELEYVCKGFNLSVGDDMSSSLACVDDDEEEEVSLALQSSEIQFSSSSSGSKSCMTVITIKYVWDGTSRLLLC